MSDRLIPKTDSTEVLLLTNDVTIRFVSILLQNAPPKTI